jgi:hypothetical protein
MSTGGAAGTSAVVQITGNNAGLKQSLTQSASMLKDFAQGVVIGGAAAVGTALLEHVGQGIAALGDYIASSVDKAQALERQMIRLNSVLENSGNKTGFTKKQLEAFNEEMGRTTIYSENASRAVELMFLKAKNISGDAFKDGLKAAADLAAQTGETLEQAGAKVAHMLKNPMAGASEAGANPEQIRRITETQNSGALGKAQQMIIQLLNAQNQGTAAKIAETGLGEMEMLQNRVDKSSEEFGKKFLPIYETIVKIRIALVDAFAEISAALSADVSSAGTWLQAYLEAGGGAKGFKEIVDALVASFKSLNSIWSVMTGTSNTLAGSLEGLFTLLRKAAVAHQWDTGQITLAEAQDKWIEIDRDAKIAKEKAVLAEVDKRRAVKQAAKKAQDEMFAEDAGGVGPGKSKGSGKGYNATEVPKSEGSLVGTFEGLEAFYTRLSSGAAGNRMLDDVIKEAEEKRSNDAAKAQVTFEEVLEVLRNMAMGTEQVANNTKNLPQPGALA